MTPAWVVRTGQHGERDSWALSNGLCGGGWKEVGDLTHVSTREQMQEIVAKVFGTDQPGAIPNYTGQLWSLRARIAVGDTIVLPLKTTKQIAVGTVSGGYAYEPEVEPSLRHRIPVEWKRIDVPRTAIKQDLLFSLGSAMTIFQVTKNDAAWRVAQILATGSDPGSKAAPIPDLTTVPDADVSEQQPDLQEYALARIQSLIQENFSGHDLARLVEAVLAADGFVCERKPPGADGGVDILAGRGPLGLDEPRVVVQVKSESAPVGDPVVQTLQGAITRFSASQALLVAWGGVNKNAEKFLETTKFSIRVWDASALMDALFRTYPQLPEDIRAGLPLKQIWIPVQELDK